MKKFKLATQPKRLLGLFAGMAVLVLIGMHFTPETEIKAYWYVNPITRFPDFILGMLLYQVYERMKALPLTRMQGTLLEVGSILLFLTCYLYAEEVPKVYRYACYYWLPVAILLLSFALQRGLLARLLSNRWFVKGGEISYSFYLIHLFILLTFANWQKGSDIDIAWYLSVPILFCIALGLSLLSYQYFERLMNKRIKSLLN